MLSWSVCSYQILTTSDSDAECCVDGIKEVLVSAKTEKSRGKGSMLGVFYKNQTSYDDRFQVLKQMRFVDTLYCLKTQKGKSEVEWPGDGGKHEKGYSRKGCTCPLTSRSISRYSLEASFPPLSNK